MNISKGFLVAIIAILAAITGISLIDDDNDGKPDKAVIPLAVRSPAIPDTVPVDTADPDSKPDTDLKISPTAQAVAQSYVNNPKDLSNAGSVALSGTGVQKKVGVVPFPWAADELPPCRTRFFHTNFSARSVSLSRVVIFEFHYTAGPDIPNSRADVDGLTAFGSRSSSRVSWHINMDKDGNCDYNVPFRSKAWTIANLNSYTINMEVAGRGESPYLRPGGYRALAQIMKQIMRAYPGIKFQIASTSNCVPIRGGMDTHWRGGPCSGGHSDIKPQDLAAVIATLKTYMGPQFPPITKKQKAVCHQINEIRRQAAKTGKWTPKGKANRLKAKLTRHHLKCYFKIKLPDRTRHLVRR